MYVVANNGFKSNNMQHVCMNRHAQNSLKALRNALPLDGLLLCQVYGSHVWGTARPDSDLDVYIITKEFSWRLNHRLQDIITSAPDGVKKADVWQLDTKDNKKYGWLYGTREHFALHHGITLYCAPDCPDDIFKEHPLEWCVKEWLRFSKVALYDNSTFNSYRACEYAVKACLLHKGIRFNHKDARDLPRMCASLPFKPSFDPEEMTGYRIKEEVDDKRVASQARDMIRLTEGFVNGFTMATV